MNKTIIIQIVLLAGFCLLSILLPAQSLQEQITDCYHNFIDNKLTLAVDIKVWERDQKGAPIDKTTFIYTNDSNGFYTKTLDFEVIQNDKLTIRLDHGIKEVALIPSPTMSSVPAEEILPRFLGDLNQLDSMYTIESEKEGNVNVFTLLEAGQIGSIFKIKGNHFQQIIQYPSEKVFFEGEYIYTVMEMNYNYKPVQNRLRIKDILQEGTNGVELKGKYKSYKVADYRNASNNK